MYYSNIFKLYFSQSSEIELLVRNVTLQQKGTYTCGAKNIAGNSESTTEVSIMGKINNNLFLNFVYFSFISITYVYYGH